MGILDKFTGKSRHSIDGLKLVYMNEFTLTIGQFAVRATIHRLTHFQWYISSGESGFDFFDLVINRMGFYQVKT